MQVAGNSGLVSPGERGRFSALEGENLPRNLAEVGAAERSAALRDIVDLDRLDDSVREIPIAKRLGVLGK